MDGRSRQVWLAWGAIIGQAVFVGGWLVLGAIEGDGFSPAEHDISDLGALTAHHAGLDLLTLGLSGVLTMAFAVWALRPALAAPGHRPAVGASLVALSLVSLDSLSDAFFRLDCRAADAGCSTADSTSSWHGNVHVLAFVIAALATIAAPFALAARMRMVDGWDDLVRPTRAFGVLVVVALVATGAAQGTGVQGTTQRVAATIVALGVVALALRVRKLAPAA